MKVYGDSQSGNCYKIQLLLSLSGKKCEWVELDILAGATQSEDFLSKNPNGKIPLLELDNGECLSESNAILHYLASGSELTGRDPLEQARVLQWQFFEQYSHEPYIAVARFIQLYLGLPQDRQQEFHSKQQGGIKALKVMEQQLSTSEYLCGNNLTLADISLYAYTHVAHEGGFDLAAFPAIGRWLTRIEAQTGYMPMQSKK